MSLEGSDPVIDEIRAIRQQISARFDHDPARMVAYYMENQQRLKDKLATYSQARRSADVATSAASSVQLPDQP